MALETSSSEGRPGAQRRDGGRPQRRVFQARRRAAPVHVLGSAAAPAPQAALEAGGVLLLPARLFDLGAAAAMLFGEVSDGRAKNVSYDPRTGVLKGAELAPAQARQLSELLAGFGHWCERLLGELVPAYAGRLQRTKASFRPRPADAPVSPRKDDRRLHADAFPSQPVQGRRILRVFRNINPDGEERLWEVGEPFGDYAARFLPRARAQAPLEAAVLRALRLTKGWRAAYDHLMLQMHDAAKADDDYQAHAPRRMIRFPSGATWIVFTDCVPHAALKGRYALEQTFLLPVEAMADPEASPLRVLERMTGRRLA